MTFIGHGQINESHCRSNRNIHFELLEIVHRSREGFISIFPTDKSHKIYNQEDNLHFLLGNSTGELQYTRYY